MDPPTNRDELLQRIREERAALERALAGPDPLLREHAAWAAAQQDEAELTAALPLGELGDRQRTHLLPVPAGAKHPVVGQASDDGRLADGRAARPGLYLIALQVGDQRRSVRAILLP